MAYQNFTNLTDWQYDTVTKKLKHNTGSTRITVQALYSEIQNEFDELVQMDDTVPMKYNTPTEYELINGWTFDADASVGYLYGGSIKVNQTDDTWANFYTIGTIESDAVVYWYQNAALVASHPGYTTGHIDQLIKVRAAGADVSTDATARNVVALIRNNASANADLYDYFASQAPTTGGRNPVPVATAPDLNDTGGGATYSGVSIVFGSMSGNMGNGAYTYDLYVDGGGATVAQMYEALKYRTRRESTTSMTTVGIGTVEGRFYRYANNTYTAVKSAPFGTFAGGKFFGARGVFVQNVSDQNNLQLIDAGGTIRNPPVTMAAIISSVVSGDRCFMARSAFQTFTAGDNGAGKIRFTSDTHGLLAGTVVNFAGGTLPTNISAGVNYYVLSSGLAAGYFEVSTTLGGTSVAYSAAGSGSSWYAPLMTWKKQFTYKAAGSGASTLVINETPDTDIPTGAGVIRVGDTRYAFSARTASTFTVTGNPVTDGMVDGAACYVPIIDAQASGTSVSATLTYVADFAVVGRVRKYATGANNSILPFENTGTVTSAGLTMSAIRTVDTVAT